MQIQVVPVLSDVGETIPEFPASDALEEMLECVAKADALSLRPRLPPLKDRLVRSASTDLGGRLIAKARPYQVVTLSKVA